MLEELKRSMAERTDQELYDILFVHIDDWTPEAHEAARGEFTARNLVAPSVEDSEAVRTQTRVKDDAPLEWPARLLTFFLGGACGGIPGLLLFRHYLAQGQRRKAEEIRDWGFYGLGFYVALGIVLKVVLPAITR